jgi:transcriptional regulator with XRE-family HTH domain
MKGRSPQLTIEQALSQKIAELLHQRGWSQREFAQIFGVSQSSVSHMLLAKRRSEGLCFYRRLAELFDVSLSELFRELEARVAASERAFIRRSRKEGRVPVRLLEEPARQKRSSHHGARRPLLPETVPIDPALEEAIHAIAQQLWQRCQELIDKQQRARAAGGGVRRQHQDRNAEVDDPPDSVSTAAPDQPGRGLRHSARNRRAS